MTSILLTAVGGDMSGLQGEVLRALQSSLTQSEQRDLVSVAINLFLAAGMSWILGILYVKCGRSLSNRRSFASNFVLVTVATMVIITIVKSSLALSLGLVGALSIVRYRTAIKEPEELSFLLIAIAIGLGFGANQPKTTMLSFSLIGIVIIARSLLMRRRENQNLNLIVTADKNLGVSTESICQAVQAHSSQLHMKRFDQNDENVEITFLAGFKDFAAFESCRKALTKLNDRIGISYLDGQSYL